MATTTTPAIDYAAIAKQFGGKTLKPGDPGYYDDLAKQFGGDSQPAEHVYNSIDDGAAPRSTASFLPGAIADTINNAYQKYKNAPVIKQASQAIGGVTGAAGGAVAAVETPIFQGVSNLINKRPLTENVISATKKNVVDTAKAGYQMGREGGAAAPLAALGSAGAVGRVIGGALAYGQGVQGVRDLSSAQSPEDVATGLIELGTAGLGGRGAFKGVGEMITPRAKAVLEITRPDLNIAEKGTAIAEGRGTVKGLLRKQQIAPSTRDMQVAEATKNIVKPKATLNENVNSVRDALTKEATKLSGDLKKANITYTPQELDAHLSQVEKPVMIASDPVLTKAYDISKNKFLDIAKKEPQTMDGLLEARKKFDQFTNKQFPDLYSNERMTPMRQALKDIRNSGNDFIESKLPDGSPFRQSLKTQSLYYDAIENMSHKAAKTVGVSTIKKAVGKHLYNANALFAGGIGAGTALKVFGINGSRN